MAKRKLKRHFTPTRKITIISFDGFIEYYKKTIYKKIWSYRVASDDIEDIYQEIILVLLALWNKYQDNKIAYLTSDYVNVTIGNFLKNYFQRLPESPDAPASFFKKCHVVSLDDIDLDEEKFEDSFEKKAAFLEVEQKVTSQLELVELQVYDRLKEGKSRDEIFKELKWNSPRKYDQIVKKIRRLFKKYI